MALFPFGSKRFRAIDEVSSNYVQVEAPSLPATYGLILPTTQGGVGQSLINDGFGTLSWYTPVALTAQSANTVFAGPTVGSPATPTFRSLVVADLPATVMETTVYDTLNQATDIFNYAVQMAVALG